MTMSVMPRSPRQRQAILGQLPRITRADGSPIRVLLVGDQSYLEAWSREAEGVRLFRFDRILDAEVLDEPAAPPRPAVDAPPHTALFDADPSLPSATLRISPAAAWMLEYFPMRVVAELPDGRCEVQMTYAAEDWMARQLLGFGADVEVLAPESLAGRVRRAASEALAAYAAMGSGAAG